MFVEDADYRADRTAQADAVVESPATKRLIVAGPGTGKTYVFKRALQQAGEKGLALTFLQYLARDLSVELGDAADAYTFHGYCKLLLHQKALGRLPVRPPLLPAAI